SLRQRWIISNGQGAQGGYDDVWALDLSPGAPADSAIWARLPSGPPSRFGAAVWLDSDRDRVLQAGGLLLARSAAVDVWALDLQGGPGWENLVPDSLTFQSTFGQPAILDEARHQWVAWVSGLPWAHDTGTDLPWHLVPVRSGQGFALAVTARDPGG